MVSSGHSPSDVGSKQVGSLLLIYAIDTNYRLFQHKTLKLSPWQAKVEGFEDSGGHVASEGVAVCGDNNKAARPFDYEAVTPGAHITQESASDIR